MSFCSLFPSLSHSRRPAVSLDMRCFWEKEGGQREYDAVRMPRFERCLVFFWGGGSGSSMNRGLVLTFVFWGFATAGGSKERRVCFFFLALCWGCCWWFFLWVSGPLNFFFFWLLFLLEAKKMRNYLMS